MQRRFQSLTGQKRGVLRRSLNFIVVLFCACTCAPDFHGGHVFRSAMNYVDDERPPAWGSWGEVTHVGWVVWSIFRVCELVGDTKLSARSSAVAGPYSGRLQGLRLAKFDCDAARERPLRASRKSTSTAPAVNRTSTVLLSVIYIWLKQEQGTNCQSRRGRGGLKRSVYVRTRPVSDKWSHRSRRMWHLVDHSAFAFINSTHNHHFTTASYFTSPSHLPKPLHPT